MLSGRTRTSGGRLHGLTTAQTRPQQQQPFPERQGVLTEGGLVRRRRTSIACIRSLPQEAFSWGSFSFIRQSQIPTNSLSHSAAAPTPAPSPIDKPFSHSGFLASQCRRVRETRTAARHSGNVLPHVKSPTLFLSCSSQVLSPQSSRMLPHAQVTLGQAGAAALEEDQHIPVVQLDECDEPPRQATAEVATHPARLIALPQLD